VIYIGARVGLFGPDLREALAVRPADEYGFLARGLFVGGLQSFAPVDLEIAENRHFLGERGCSERQRGDQAEQCARRDSAPSNGHHSLSFLLSA